MLELLIRGGDVVTPEGIATCDVAIAGERIAAIAAPGAFPTQSAVDQARRHAARHRRPRPGRPRRAPRRHHDAHRFRLLARGPIRAAGDRIARQGFCRIEPVRLGLPHHAALRAPAGVRGPARRGDPGRLSNAEDLHHQHPALAFRAHDRFWRHLGGIPGSGERGRARRHSRGGQRHRHAHVRQADPRGPRRLRASR